jgi:hypothetical protein
MQHWAQDTKQRQTKQKTQHRKLKRPEMNPGVSEALFE